MLSSAGDESSNESGFKESGVFLTPERGGLDLEDDSLSSSLCTAWLNSSAPFRSWSRVSPPDPLATESDTILRKADLRLSSLATMSSRFASNKPRTLTMLVPHWTHRCHSNCSGSGPLGPGTQTTRKDEICFRTEQNRTEDTCPSRFYDFSTVSHQHLHSKMPNFLQASVHWRLLMRRT